VKPVGRRYPRLGRNARFVLHPAAFPAPIPEIINLLSLTAKSSRDPRRVRAASRAMLRHRRSIGWPFNGSQLGMGGEFFQTLPTPVRFSLDLPYHTGELFLRQMGKCCSHQFKGGLNGDPAA
jgi:hypothetical protein